MAEEAEKADEEKKPRVYKGDPMEVKGLTKGTIVQALPEARKSYKLPLFMVVSDVVDSYRSNKEKMVTYLDPRDGFRPRTAYVPAKLELNVLTGRMGVELKKELADYKKSNMAAFVVCPGVSLGSDPELFITNGQTDEIIPAWELLPSKKKPLTVPNDNYGSWKNTTAYWDGFQAEFTTNVTTCLAYQTDEVRRSLKLLYDHVKKKNKKAFLSISSVLPVPDGSLESAKDEHVEFGCMPSMNAYGLEGNKTPGRQVPIRFAGGHLHFGLESLGMKYSKGQYENIAKGLDKILGTACVSLFEGYDVPIRRQYYGLPGEYRLPKHGIEYRTLSNAWLIHPVIMNLVYEIGRAGIGFGLSGMLEEWNSPEEETIEAIQNNDVELARKILERNKDLWQRITNQRGLSGSTGIVYSFVMGGMEGKLKCPRDLAANWILEQDYWNNHGGGAGRSWAGVYNDILRKGFKLQ